MICPKCKSENQFGNFCSECGNQLKEKCPECGEMEPIGRKVCETKLEDVKQARKEYIKNKVGEWREITGLIMGFAPFFVIPTLGITGLIPSLIPKKYLALLSLYDWQIICGFFFLAILCFLLGKKKQKQAEQKARQKFLQENPDYAEILRKAEKT